MVRVVVENYYTQIVQFIKYLNLRIFTSFSMLYLTKHMHRTYFLYLQMSIEILDAHQFRDDVCSNMFLSQF